MALWIVILSQRGVIELLFKEAYQLSSLDTLIFQLNESKWRSSAHSPYDCDLTALWNWELIAVIPVY
jgi:hypothetical protein